MTRKILFAFMLKTLLALVTHVCAGLIEAVLGNTAPDVPGAVCGVAAVILACMLIEGVAFWGGKPPPQ
ncbi:MULTISPECIES: hypothetical protein [unclassified Bradyrhizobium]|uniref:hypothetical protein n=1 Tax=unclassified Bradyrhizobium TaxID=2631580 RepID=UPI0028EC30D8|nr:MULTISPECIES: hypothetical protein [unclassified Bradyrhizobium]